MHVFAFVHPYTMTGLAEETGIYMAGKSSRTHMPNSGIFAILVAFATS